jgi:hypothetical protein
MHNLFTRLFRLRPEDTIKEGLWSASFMEQSKTFDVVMDCPQCRQKLQWRLTVSNLFNTTTVHVRHCRKDDVLPKALVIQMRAYIADRKKRDETWSEGETWDDIEAQGQRIL